MTDCSDAYDMGSKRELLLDSFLIDKMEGAQLVLHPPTARDVVLVTDKPWEGNMNTFNTVFHDGEKFRLYYRGWQVDLTDGKSEGESINNARPPCVCLAESTDGIHWERSPVNQIEHEGSKENNIVWKGEGWHGFSPFLDPNPDASPDAQYKAVGVMDGWPCPGLMAIISPDGVNWSRLQGDPIITDGDFDSHNLVFWDPVRCEYRAYVRQLRDGSRDIKTATSPDFVNWTKPEWLEYTNVPTEQLYTNNIQPYYRAPHIFVGFPARYVERPWTPSMDALPELEHRQLRSSIKERFGTALSDGVFMSSRDGQTFRRWGEAFIRPGLRPEGSWTYGDMYPAWGMIETDSDMPGGVKELSMFASEDYWRGESTTIRRYTLRIDGFVSANAPLSGAELVTKPLIFAGSQLSLNISTSAAGNAFVEIQDDSGKPIPGYSTDDCWEIIGDTLDYTVRWKNGTDASPLAGRPIRLRFTMKDADLYSFQFV